MKVQSWPTLLITIFGGGGLLAWTVCTAEAHDLMFYLWAALYVYLIVRGLRVSFSREAYAEYRERSARARRILRARFGALAPVALYLPLVPILLAMVPPLLFPGAAPATAAALILLFAGVGLQICFRRWFDRRMREEEAREREDLAPPPDGE